jgi:hypothetical protein
VKKGLYPIKNIGTELLREAMKTMLSDNGIKAGLTKEKMNGTYKRPAHLTPETMRDLNNNYVVEFANKYFEKYPRMFEIEPQARDMILNTLKGERIKLRKYPKLVEAMF